MIYYCDTIKDTIGNNYIAIKFSNNSLDHFILDLIEHLGDDSNDYIKNQQNRDNFSYHLTVINVAEFNMLAKKDGYSKFVDSLAGLFNFEIDDLKMLGIGKSSRNENTSYYIVCESKKLDSIRRRYGLSDKDFHITIGFSPKDVFGVRKNEVIKLNNNFLKLLKNEFYKNENWNFVKNISNYDLDKRGNVEVVEITDSSFLAKMQNYYLNIKLVDDEFRIVNQWGFSDSDDKPSLSVNDVTNFFIKKFN